MDNESETQVDSSASGRRDPRWKYACLVNEKNLNIIICIFVIKEPNEIYIHTNNILLVDIEMLKSVENVRNMLKKKWKSI